MQKLWKNEWGGEIIFSNGCTNARGVAIMFTRNLDFKIQRTSRDMEGRWLQIEMLFKDLVIQVINVYAPNNDNVEFFQSVFNNVLNTTCDHFIIGGDLNKALNNSLDRKSATQNIQISESVNYINECLDEYSWVDIWRYMHPSEKTFTWLRRKKLCMSRLDYFFISQASIDSVVNCNITPGCLSDHSIVQLDFEFNALAKGAGVWKLNTSHLRDITFVEKN